MKHDILPVMDINININKGIGKLVCRFNQRRKAYRLEHHGITKTSFHPKQNFFESISLDDVENLVF